ncbi:uncharacterized protein [Aquarana catesbeiana]|uniref:uncharacterized protein isoform X1 n=1 Tax=Aquarana catesbeiana TaxID=8400 RepID=UPI003CCA3038
MFTEGNELSRRHDDVPYTPPGYGTRHAIPMWMHATAPPADQLQNGDSPPPSYESVVDLPTCMPYQPPSQILTPSTEQENIHALSEYDASCAYQINNSTPTAQQWNRQQLNTEHNTPSTSEMINTPSTGYHWNAQRLNTLHTSPNTSQRAHVPPSVQQFNTQTGYPEYNNPIPSLPVNNSNRTSFQNLNSSQASENFTPVYPNAKSRCLGVLLICLSLVQLSLAVKLVIFGEYDNLKTISYGIVFICLVFYTAAAFILLWIRFCSNQAKAISSFIAITFIFSSAGLVFNFLDINQYDSCIHPNFFRLYLHCRNTVAIRTLFYVITGINAVVLLMSMLFAIC